jgi:hypothetical protein
MTLIGCAFSSSGDAKRLTREPSTKHIGVLNIVDLSNISVWFDSEVFLVYGSRVWLQITASDDFESGSFESETESSDAAEGFINFHGSCLPFFECAS